MSTQKPSVMDELEALKAVTNTTESVTETDKNRERAASQWTSHYMAVLAVKENFIASGGKPEEFTKELAVKLLLADWSTKRNTAI
jgi:hypothetical protein